MIYHIKDIIYIEDINVQGVIFMKKYMNKLLILVCLTFIFVGCTSTTGDKDDNNTAGKITQIDDNETSKQTLENEFQKLQGDLEKEGGYTINSKCSYKEEEANGLKYVYGIEKQTNSDYELYEISVYYNDDYAIDAEKQWNKIETSKNNKRVGIYEKEEENEIYYTYRKNNMIITVGGYKNNQLIINVLKDYFKIDL